jgi:hypothetical protein
MEMENTQSDKREMLENVRAYQALEGVRTVAEQS